MTELLYREQTGKTLKGYYAVYNGTSCHQNGCF